VWKCEAVRSVQSRLCVYSVFDLFTLHSSVYHIAQVVGLLGSSSFICTASGGGETLIHPQRFLITTSSSRKGLRTFLTYICHINYISPISYSRLTSLARLFCDFYVSNESCASCESWLIKVLCTYNSFLHLSINPLTPNDRYSGPTAPLTSKRCILYIYSTNVGTEYFKHDI
jgi:hypothetical protein